MTTQPRHAARLRLVSWLLVATTASLAILVWGQTYGWRLIPVSTYQWFPLLGLLAFSIMWTHYVAWTIRDHLQLDKAVLADYFRWTSYAVLALILLHPGLLLYQRLSDGYGLPPGSYISYVGPGLGWVATLGAISLVIFLAFELHRKYGDRPWWHWVADASDLAMLLIFYHGLRLGSQLQQGWFRYVWWFYGLVLAVVLIRKYYLRLKT